MAQLLYQGHGSFRIVSESGFTIYVDPYAGEGYDRPADLILVTHEHDDHNNLSLVTQKPDCRVITEQEAQKGNEYQNFRIGPVKIRAVPAYNQNHKPEECVGYVLLVDGVKLYAAGDTSHTEAMERLLPQLHLDYALLPIDGVYNMDAAGASECAKEIAAAHTIPIHMMPGALFDEPMAQQFQAPGRIILPPNGVIDLFPGEGE